MKELQFSQGLPLQRIYKKSVRAFNYAECERIYSCIAIAKV